MNFRENTIQPITVKLILFFYVLQFINSLIVQIIIYFINNTIIHYYQELFNKSMFGFYSVITTFIFNIYFSRLMK